MADRSHRPPPGLPPAPNVGLYQFPIPNSNWRSASSSQPLSNFDQVFPTNFTRAPFPFSMPPNNYGHGPSSFSYASFRQPQPQASSMQNYGNNSNNGFSSTMTAPSYTHSHSHSQSSNFEQELPEFSLQQLLRRYPVSENFQKKQQEQSQGQCQGLHPALVRQQQEQEKQRQEWQRLERQQQAKQKEEEAELYPFLEKLANFIISTPQLMDEWMKIQSDNGFLKPLPKDPIMFWTLSDKSVLDEFAALRPDDYKDTVHLGWPTEDLLDVESLLQQAGPVVDAAPLSPTNSQYPPEVERQRQQSSSCSGEENSLSPHPVSSSSNSSGSRGLTPLKSDSPNGSSDIALPGTPEYEEAWSPRLVNAKTAMANLTERFNGLNIPDEPPPNSYIYHGSQGKTVFVQNPINHRYYPLAPDPPVFMPPSSTLTGDSTPEKQNSQGMRDPCLTFGHNHCASECDDNNNEYSMGPASPSSPKTFGSSSNSGSPRLSPKPEAGAAADESNTSNNNSSSSGNSSKDKSASHKFYDAFMAAYAAVRNEEGPTFADLVNFFSHEANGGGCGKKLNMLSVNPTKQQNSMTRPGYFNQEPRLSRSLTSSDESAGEGPVIEIRGAKKATFKKLEKKGTKKEFLCVFCLKNDEPEETYKSHPIRVDGIVTCPFLREHICALCGASGDAAHTIKYCPYNKRGFFALKAVERTEGPDAELALKIRNDMDESFRRFKFNSAIQSQGDNGQGIAAARNRSESPRFQFPKTSSSSITGNPRRIGSAPDNFGSSSSSAAAAAAASGSQGFLRRGKVFNRRRVHSVERERMSSRERDREEIGPRHYFGPSPTGSGSSGPGIGHDNRQRTNASFNFGRGKFVAYPKKTYRRYLPRSPTPRVE